MNSEQVLNYSFYQKEYLSYIPLSGKTICKCRWVKKMYWKYICIIIQYNRLFVFILNTGRRAEKEGVLENLVILSCIIWLFSVQRVSLIYKPCLQYVLSFWRLHTIWTFDLKHQHLYQYSVYRGCKWCPNHVFGTYRVFGVFIRYDSLGLFVWEVNNGGNDTGQGLKT